MFGIQLMFIARDNFASRLGTIGSVSSLTYGWMIMQVPETLIGTAIATALLPTISEYAARSDWAAFRQTIEKAVRVMVTLTLPIAAVMAVGLRPLVQFTFGFDPAGTDLLAWTTRVFLLTLAGYSVQEVMARAFYARKEAWWPFFSVTMRIVIYLTVGILAISYFKGIGAPAIPLAELSLTVEAIFLLFVLNRKLPERITAGSSVLKGFGAALVSGAMAYALAVCLPEQSHPVNCSLHGDVDVRSSRLTFRPSRANCVCCSTCELPTAKASWLPGSSSIAIRRWSYRLSPGVTSRQNSRGRFSSKY